MELEAAIDINPNLIIPFAADDEDIDSEFALNMKKCRKPRVTAKSKQKAAAAAAASKTELQQSLVTP